MTNLPTPTRILLTGSRAWDNRQSIREALEFELQALPVHQPVVLVHGACPTGADQLGDDIWCAWRRRFPVLFEAPERHPEHLFVSPLARNDHMVSLGAHVCLTFARLWASRTGQCARAARRACIRTVDLGVSTRVEDRPEAVGGGAR
uniref:SLOG family protein n=1 Tax=Pseudonocardia sp. CA-138482 TaxID=3240023 RepID=UPI003F49484E